MKKVRGLLLLSLLGFSVFFVIVAPYEMVRTIRARDWKPVDVEVVTHKIVRWRGRYSAKIEARDLASSETSSSVEVRYGDVALSLDVFGRLLASDLYEDRETFHPGAQVTAYRSADGLEYVLEQNSIRTMLAIFLCACVYPAIAVVSVARSGGRTQSDCQKS